MPPATLLVVVAVLLAVAAAGSVAEAAAPGGSVAEAAAPGGSGTVRTTSSDELQQDPVIHSITLAPGRVNQLEIHYDGLTFDRINITDSGQLLLPNASSDGAALRKVKKEEQGFRIADYVLAAFALVSASLNAWLISRRPQQANPPPQQQQQDNPPQQQQQGNPPQQPPQTNNTNNMYILVNR